MTSPRQTEPHSLRENTTRLRSLDDWFSDVYEALHETAAYWFGAQPCGHTLQPTAIVHETYVRLHKRLPTSIPNRKAFFALAARAMRHALVDHARRRNAAKRATAPATIDLDADVEGSPGDTVGVVALHEAIDRLEARNARAARVLELRVFGGLSIADVADSLHVSPRTINLDWRYARACLLRDLGESDEEATDTSEPS